LLPTYASSTIEARAAVATRNWNRKNHLPRQSEIEKLEGRPQKADVVGLQVPVGNVVGMDVFEGFCQLVADGEFFEVVVPRSAGGGS